MENDIKQNEAPVFIPDGLKKLGDLKQFQKGEMLFSAQDEANGFYYVERGEICVYKMDEQGREVEVVRLGPGDFLGEAIVFVSSVYSVFAQAVMDSDILFFGKRKISQEMAKNTSIAMYFEDLLARKCVVLSNKIESLVLRTVRQRLIRYLLSQCSEEQKCRCFSSSAISGNYPDIAKKKSRRIFLYQSAFFTLRANQSHYIGFVVVHSRYTNTASWASSSPLQKS
jgi:signal-transduction protein with cAMP-binding, CBS, and nucleotidyltransferase domain